MWCGAPPCAGPLGGPGPRGLVWSGALDADDDRTPIEVGRGRERGDHGVERVEVRLDVGRVLRLLVGRGPALGDGACARDVEPQQRAVGGARLLERTAEA